MLGIYLIGDSEKRVADQDAISRIRNSPEAIGYLTEATGFFLLDPFLLDLFSSPV